MWATLLVVTPNGSLMQGKITQELTGTFVFISSLIMIIHNEAGCRKFAANIGIQFYTPEEFFLKESKAPFTWGEFIPSEYPAKSCKAFHDTYIYQSAQSNVASV